MSALTSDLLSLKKVVQQESRALIPKTIARYQWLHAHPELSFEETQTACFICKELTAMDIPHQLGIGGNGILATITGEREKGRVIALRADMDALPVSEETNLPYQSQKQGCMHACGHDAHVAILLGVVELIWNLRTDFAGTLLAIFQPGEERHPGGARVMLESGLFDTIRPDLIIGQHVNLDHPTGSVALSSGCVMAAADEFHIQIEGTGGHGALPHRLNDTVLAAAQVVVSLQQIVSRRVDPFHPAVLTIGKFMAEGATNVIPHTVYLSGTLRTMDSQDREMCHHLIREIVESTATAYGCRSTIDLKNGYPPVINDESVTLSATGFLQELLGAPQVHAMERRMTGEDFGFFSEQYPALFYRLGARGSCNAECGNQHTSTFCIDENALETGVSGMSWLALRFLNTVTR